MNKQEQIDTFVGRLEQLTAGERAQLKRHAGKTLNESPKVMALFFQLLPHGIGKFNEPWFFLIATHYPLAEPRKEDQDTRTSFGLSLRTARARAKQNAEGFDRRFAALLDADENQLPFRLRQLISLHKSTDTQVAWGALLNDLTNWTHPGRFVQENWARHYYVGEPKQQDENTPQAQPATTNPTV